MKLNNEYDIHHHEDALLVFPLNITVAQWKEMKIFLQIQYMRSYTDAGMVSVGFCDQYYTKLDALWTNYQQFHHTLKDVYSVYVNPEWCTPSASDSSLVELSVKYQVVRDDDNDVTALMGRKPRRYQLFKIDSILLCGFA